MKRQKGEEIKPIALAIIELRLSEGIHSQSDNQSISRKICQINSNLMQRLSEDVFWAWLCLTNAAMLLQSKYLAGLWDFWARNLKP